MKILKAQVEELENDKGKEISPNPKKLKVINSLRDIRVTSLDDINQNDNEDAASYQSSEQNFALRQPRPSNFI